MQFLLPKRVNIPVVMTRDEISRVTPFLNGTVQLIVKLLYGSGLRIMEALRLRVQEIHFHMKSITVRSGKGAEDRVTTFPVSVAPLLQSHLAQVRAIHGRDLSQGFGEVYLPHALAGKYPSAPKDRGWQQVFPAGSLSTGPLSGVVRRHHIDPRLVNKAIKVAVRKAGITRKITAHSFRRSFATHLLQRGTDIRTIQSRRGGIGRSDVSTTMIHTQLLQQGGHGVPSPLDDLGL